jgi:hypothetical protein
MWKLWDGGNEVGAGCWGAEAERACSRRLYVAPDWMRRGGRVATC